MTVVTESRLQELQRCIQEERLEVLCTARDRRHTYQQYKVWEEEGPLRVTLAYALKDGALVEAQEERWGLARIPGPRWEDLRRVLPQALDGAYSAEQLASLVEGIRPYLALEGNYYIEALYRFEGYLLRLFYPLLGKRSTTPFKAVVEAMDPLCSHVDGLVLPYEIEAEAFAPFGGTVSWAANYVGFGQLVFRTDGQGRVHCDNECMSREFIKQVLCKLVDDMVLED